MHTVGVVSGYFDPIHSGHINYINEAKKNCDKLIVIVNNDRQAKMKKNYSFMNEKERCLILENIKNVDEVILSIDDDKTVRRSLEYIKSIYKDCRIIFMNGGDRNEKNIPELDIQGVEFLFNVGGPKTNSSSDIVASYYNSCS